MVLWETVGRVGWRLLIYERRSLPPGQLSWCGQSWALSAAHHAWHRAREAENQEALAKRASKGWK